jgi:hypothetical protein
LLRVEPRNFRRCRVVKPRRRVDSASNFLAALALDERDVVLALQVEPGLRPIAEVATEAYRRVGGNAAPAVQNVGDPKARRGRGPAGWRSGPGP